LNEAIEHIVVLGSWSSGSTAVTGYLERLGAHSAPPHQPTSDPRTPDSHEPVPLRNALAARIEETSLEPRTTELPPFRDWLRDWLAGETERALEAGSSHIVLKHPLLAFFLEDLQAVCAPRFILVTRPVEAIEASRQRRQWHPVYGRAGAGPIYNQIFTTCLNEALETLVLGYTAFREDPALRQRLTRWLGLAPTPEAWENAEAWLR
jgi:hypothetical protein